MLLPCKRVVAIKTHLSHVQLRITAHHHTILVPSPSRVRTSKQNSFPVWSLSSPLTLFSPARPHEHKLITSTTTRTEQTQPKMLDRQHSAKLTKAGPQMIRVNYDGVISIPEGRGLLLRLDSNSGNAFLEAVEDHHAPTIHPNCYIPDSFSKLRFLQGGGSGAAVFAGSHPVLNNCVMKHASCKDTREVLSLAEIGNELKRRDPIAAKYLRERIPEFAFFYVSPFHVRDRSKELCATMRHDTCQKLMLRQDSSTDRPDESDSSEEDEQTENGFSMRKRSNHVGQVKRNLQLHRGEPLGLETFFTKVMFHIPSCTDEGLIPDGHEFLSRFVDHLEAAQQDNYWKITVGQKAIGGPTSNNGAFVLTSGRLKGALLEKTIEEYTTVLRNLRALTLPEEKNILQQVRDEVQQLEQIGNVESISKACDQFVGSAIRKNFHPFKGRFAIMREIGENIRDGSLVFTQRETVPAEILGRLLEKGNSLSSIFSHSPRFPCALDKVEGSWLDLLQTATSFEDTVLTDRIWTCGLTDAGLHNAFICLKRGLELFDLGKPQLVPEPAFLTKFLMSLYVILVLALVKKRILQFLTDYFCVAAVSMHLVWRTTAEETGSIASKLYDKAMLFAS